MDIKYLPLMNDQQIYALKPGDRVNLGADGIAIVGKRARPNLSEPIRWPVWVRKNRELQVLPAYMLRRASLDLTPALYCSLCYRMTPLGYIRYYEREKHGGAISLDAVCDYCALLLEDQYVAWLNANIPDRSQREALLAEWRKRRMGANKL